MRKAVLVLRYVIWMVIGPIIKKLVIGEWMKSRVLTSDWWVTGINFFVIVQYPAYNIKMYKDWGCILLFCVTYCIIFNFCCCLSFFQSYQRLWRSGRWISFLAPLLFFVEMPQNQLWWADSGFDYNYWLGFMTIFLRKNLPDPCKACESGSIFLFSSLWMVSIYLCATAIRGMHLVTKRMEKEWWQNDAWLEYFDRNQCFILEWQTTEQQQNCCLAVGNRQNSIPFRNWIIEVDVPEQQWLRTPGARSL